MCLLQREQIINSSSFLKLMKQSLSSFELSHIVSELDWLVGAKIEKVFQQAKPVDDVLVSLHVPSKGKVFLFLSLQKRFV